MAHSIRHLTAVTLAWVALTVPVSSDPLAEPLRQLTFTVFAPQPTEGLVYLPQPGAPPIALIFYPTARSPRYTYRGSTRLQLLDPELANVKAEVTLPARIQNALLILFPVEPAKSGAIGYRIEALDDDPSRHEPGTLLILNFSGLELAGTLDHRQIALQPGSNGPIRVDGAATIYLRTPFRGRSYQAFAETIPLERTSRGLLLLLPPYRPGSLEVQSRVLLDVPVSPGGVSGL